MPEGGNDKLFPGGGQGRRFPRGFSTKEELAGQILKRVYETRVQKGWKGVPEREIQMGAKARRWGGWDICTRRGGKGSPGRGHSVNKGREAGSGSLAWETAWLVCDWGSRRRSWKSLRSQRAWSGDNGLCG